MLDQMSDPDYYYHVALSKQILATGFPETVPQVKDIGWDILFTDKEYLYHVLTTFSYWMAGETGIRALSVVLFAIGSLTLLFQSFKNLGARLFFLPMIMIAVDPYFLRRMIMVRPQTLAVLLFIFIIVGFVTKRKYVILFASLLFALSYHGLQIPGILIAASLFTSFVAQPGHIKYAGYCAVGLIAGCLLNPYFPGNLAMLPQIINIVRDTSDVATLPYGGEIYPWKTSEFLKYSLVGGVVLALALSTIGNLNGSQRDQDREDYSLLMFLTATFSLFLAVAMLTPRGREYLVPTGVLLMIQILRHTPVTATALVSIMAIAQFVALKPRYNILFAPEKQTGMTEMFTALETIPVDEKAHMLNCNWSHTPYVIYKRPNLSFVDIMDPSFLFLANKSLNDARADMVQGKAPDLRFVVGDVFKAKYMLCETYKMNLAFDGDPHFERLYPAVPVSKSTAPVALFKLREPNVMPNFETEFEYSLPDSREQWTPVTAEFKSAKATMPMAYLNILQQLPKDKLTAKSDKKEERIANCLFVRPKDPGKFVDAEYIAIGGGPNIRLYVNDEPVFENTGEPDRQRLIDLLIPLTKPLKASDKIVAMVCPGVVETYFGIAMSFWSSPQIQSACSSRELPPAEGEAVVEWKYKGIQEKNCLGPIASRARPVAAAEPVKTSKKK